MSNENKQNDERATFEAWMRDCEGYPYAGHYANLMWKAWQARAVDGRVAYEQLKADYAALKYLCARAETAAAEAQVELKNLRATQQATTGDERAATGFPEADHIINRLMSSDPQFDDCADAADLIQKLVKSHRDLVSDLRAAIADTTSPVAPTTAPTDKQRHDEIFSAVTKWLDAHTVPFEAQNELFKAISSVISKAAPNPWESLFDRVALELNCLPSADVAGNDHVFAEIKKLQAEQQAPHAFHQLKAALIGDADYAWSWHCNLAMPIMDSIRCTPEHANKAAADLMQYLFGIDVRKFPQWQHEKPSDAPAAPSLATDAGAVMTQAQRDERAAMQCPYCGGYETFTRDALGQRNVVCDECEASGPTEETDEEAIAAWNRIVKEVNFARLAAHGESHEQ